MPEITVWTKQNAAVLDQLEQNGRFIADERFIRRELGDTADIMLFIYSWLADHMTVTTPRPADSVFPVWVSFDKEATMMPEDGYAVLELIVPSEAVAKLDIAKWTRITNYSYIPADAEDEEEHSRYLKELGTDNARAVMTQFWPELRMKIISSWDRLFDDSIVLGSTSAYGLMWEVRKEWIRSVVV